MSILISYAICVVYILVVNTLTNIGVVTPVVDFNTMVYEVLLFWAPVSGAILHIMVCVEEKFGG